MGWALDWRETGTLIPIRILLVDDNEPWRGVISQILQRSPRWSVVGEARDGFEAIQKSEQLQPDVIVLDLGLPLLNGLEAAREIRVIAPNSKILFLSVLACRETAELVLALGASGYVLKSESAVDLLPAMEAVVSGKQFVSPVLSRIAPKGFPPE